MYRFSNSLITVCLASLNGTLTSTGTVIVASVAVAVCGDGVTVIDGSDRGATPRGCAAQRVLAVGRLGEQHRRAR